jgi:hypothetical protein
MKKEALSTIQQMAAAFILHTENFFKNAGLNQCEATLSCYQEMSGIVAKAVQSEYIDIFLAFLIKNDFLKSILKKRQSTQTRLFGLALSFQKRIIEKFGTDGSIHESSMQKFYTMLSEQKPDCPPHYCAYDEIQLAHYTISLFEIKNNQISQGMDRLKKIAAIKNKYQYQALLLLVKTYAEYKLTGGEKWAKNLEKNNKSSEEKIYVAITYMHSKQPSFVMRAKDIFEAFLKKPDLDKGIKNAIYYYLGMIYSDTTLPIPPNMKLSSAFLSRSKIESGSLFMMNSYLDGLYGHIENKKLENFSELKQRLKKLSNEGNKESCFLLGAVGKFSESSDEFYEHQKKLLDKYPEIVEKTERKRRSCMYLVFSEYAKYAYQKYGKKEDERRYRKYFIKAILLNPRLADEEYQNFAFGILPETVKKDPVSLEELFNKDTPSEFKITTCIVEIAELAKALELLKNKYEFLFYFTHTIKKLELLLKNKEEISISVSKTLVINLCKLAICPNHPVIKPLLSYLTEPLRLIIDVPTFHALASIGLPQDHQTINYVSLFLDRREQWSYDLKDLCLLLYDSVLLHTQNYNREFNEKLLKTAQFLASQIIQTKEDLNKIDCFQVTRACEYWVYHDSLASKEKAIFTTLYQKIPILSQKGRIGEIKTSSSQLQKNVLKAVKDYCPHKVHEEFKLSKNSTVVVDILLETGESKKPDGSSDVTGIVVQVNGIQHFLLHEKLENKDEKEILLVSSPKHELTEKLCQFRNYRRIVHLPYYEIPEGNYPENCKSILDQFQQLLWFFYLYIKFPLIQLKMPVEKIRGFSKGLCELLRRELSEKGLDTSPMMSFFRSSPHLIAAKETEKAVMPRTYPLSFSPW